MNNSTSSPLSILEEIQEKKFLPPNVFNQYYQKLSHSFASFLNHPPVSPKIAEKYMEKINITGRSNWAFYTLFQDTIFDLHDWAMEGDTLTKTLADVQLLTFFAREAPHTIKRKKNLLEKINTMSRPDEKRTLLSKVIFELSEHYDKNQQYNEDPQKGVLVSLRKTLDFVSQWKKLSSSEKTSFSHCAQIIKERVPDLYETSWSEKFAIPEKRKLCARGFEEVPDAYHFKAPYSLNHYSSKIWERE